jgi:hypothetical protein
MFAIRPLLLLPLLLIPCTLLHAGDIYRLQIYCLQLQSNQITFLTSSTPSASEMKSLEQLMKDPANVLYSIDQLFENQKDITYRDGRDITYANNFDGNGNPISIEKQFIGTEVQFKNSLTTDKKRFSLSGSIKHTRENPPMTYQLKNGKSVTQPVISSFSIESASLEQELGNWLIMGGTSSSDSREKRNIIYLIRVSVPKQEGQNLSNYPVISGFIHG